MRNRIVAWLLVCVMLLAAFPAQAETDAERPAVSALLATGEGVLCVREDGVYARGSDAQPVISCPGLLRAHCEGDVIYLLSWEARQTLLAYTPQGEQLAAYSLPVEGTLFDFDVTGDQIALLYTDEKSGEARLCVWNPQTGDVTHYDQLMQPERLAADGGYLLVFCLEPTTYSPVLVLVDLTDGEITTAAENVPRGDALLLDIEKNTAYAADSAALYEISWDGKSSRTRRYALPLGSSALCLQGGEVYVYNAETGCAEAASLSAEASAALTIAGYMTEGTQNDPALAQAVGLLQGQGVEVAFRYYGSSDDLVLALMSDLDAIDLLMLTNFNLANYLRADLLMDLDDAPQIQALEASGQYAEWLFKLGRDCSGLHMLPVGDASPTLWTADAGLLSELGEELPGADWTWTDFLSLAKQCAEHGVSALEADASGTYVTTPGVTNYLTGHVDPVAQTADFDAPDFREMCEVWMECVQKGYVSGAQENRRQVFSVTAQSPALMTEEQLDSLVYPPRAGETRVVDVECSLLGVCRSSRQSEQAVDFLATLLSPEAQSGLAEYAGLPSLLIFSDYGWYEEHCQGLLTERQFDRYQEVMSMAALRDTLIPVRHAVNECLTRYFTQEASLDEVQREIGQRVGMMLFE